MAALEVGKKTAIVKDGRKKIHTVIDEHVELVEVRTTFGLLCLKMHQEFDINTDELLGTLCVIWRALLTLHLQSANGVAAGMWARTRTLVSGNMR